MSNLVEIQNLSVAFENEGEERKVIDNLSFEIPAGKVLGILGESGSGKSLTALTLMHLLPKNAIIKQGKIHFFDEENTIDWLALTKKEQETVRAKKVAMIFQEPMTSFNPTLKLGKQVVETIIENLHFSSGKAKEKTISLFEEVKLPDPEKIFGSYPHEVSGGQKQRVMIAMALASEPELLIADEPTTALDVTVQKSILDLLKQVQQQRNLTVIFISHDISVLSEISDKLLVLYKGQLIETGTVRQIINNPRHPYTKGLMACRPTLEMKRKKLPTVQDFLENKTLPEELIVSTVDKTKTVLDVKNLSVTYSLKRNLFGKTVESFQAVKTASFTVYKGETLGLVGESGCGKTTLGRTLIQLIKAGEGEISFNGQPLNNLTINQENNFRKRVQLIFQDPYASLNPRMLIGEVILEVMKVHRIGKTKKERKEKAITMLCQVGLDDSFFSRYPHELSGGQRQRIVIARALALEPEFIICDESVSALDVSVQSQILNLLNDLKQQLGLTYIFISHDLSVVKYMSDRIMVMESGKLVEINETNQIYLNPQQNYTKKLLAAIPKI
ncbi:MAG: ABC transporter ATP-binding protein [Bacteroidales bacterium]|nr:ABC transporter ATP-binding protein [Bacteroidales bacterium]